MDDTFRSTSVAYTPFSNLNKTPVVFNAFEDEIRAHESASKPALHAPASNSAGKKTDARLAFDFSAFLSKRQGVYGDSRSIMEFLTEFQGKLK